jgi:hypothetical protein
MAIPQQRMRLLTFNDPHPMRIDRDLAAEIGLNESIVLLQLEYLISISSNEREGRLWTYQSLTDLKEVYFPWWSVMTIQRIVKSLEEKRLLLIGNFNKLGYDRTQWFALNEEGINSLHSVAIYQNDKSIYQNGEMDHNKMINGFIQNDTTIPEITHEITQKNTGDGARAKKRAAPTQASLSGLHEAVQTYKELTGTRAITPIVADKIADTVTDLPRWRTVIAAWVEWGYNPKSITGMLDWYVHPEKIRQSSGGSHHGKHIRQGTEQHFERARWSEGTDEGPA